MTERKNSGFVFLFVYQKKLKKTNKLGSATRWNHICRSNYRSDSGTARPTMHPVQLISFTVIVKTPRLAFISTPPINFQPHKGRWNCLLEQSGEEIIIKDQQLCCLIGLPASQLPKLAKFLTGSQSQEVTKYTYFVTLSRFLFFWWLFYF